MTNDLQSEPALPSEEKRHNAIQASRTMLLMQWPAHTVLGLMGLLLPFLGTADDVALITSILLIISSTQALILLKYGVNPGFIWRFSIMLITFITIGLVYSGALASYFTMEQIMGGYLAGMGGYIVIESRYSFSGHHIEPVVYSGYIAGVLGLMLYTGWPDLTWWTPVMALSLHLISLGLATLYSVYNE